MRHAPAAPRLCAACVGRTVNWDSMDPRVLPRAQRCLPRGAPRSRNNTSEDLVNADFDDSMRKFIGEAQKEINGMIMGNNTHIID